jgi:ribonuclease G
MSACDGLQTDGGGCVVPVIMVKSMSKEMIVSHTSLETRVAIVEDGVVTEVSVDRAKNRGVVGNLYKGRVNRVLPGMQSAFVDVGLDRDAFLYVSDVLEDEDSPLFGVDDEDIQDAEREMAQAAKEASIDELLREGQEILAQIAKEPIGTKGARITSYISLPGRLLVFMPTVDHIGVSRKIDSSEERSRLRRLVQENRKPGGGYIVRTAAQGKDDDVILADMRFLEDQWRGIGKKMESARAPAVIHRDLGLVFKYIRDILSPDFTAIRTDSEELYEQIASYMRQIQPQMLHRVKFYSKNYPIFEEYRVQSEIDKALKSKVWLKSGGYIVINQTEALVAIDVNTGRYTGEKRLEDTITRINMEACAEVVRQIRLRDLGGIIVVDFIDMEERRNQQKVLEMLEQEVEKDRSPTKMIQINEFGLVVLTRKRVKKTLERILCQPCPYCQGSSWIKSPETVCYEILDHARLNVDDFPRGLTLRVHPDVGRALRGPAAPVLEELRTMLGADVTIRTDGNLHIEKFELTAKKRGGGGKQRAKSRPAEDGKADSAKKSANESGRRQENTRRHNGRAQASDV